VADQLSAGQREAGRVKWGADEELRSVRRLQGQYHHSAAMASGASAGDVKWDLEHGYMALHPPSEDRVLGEFQGGEGEAKYGALLMARLVLLPKKGELSLCKNSREICLLGVVWMIFSPVLVARMGVVMEKLGFGA
jgi:hypothetical protein